MWLPRVPSFPKGDNGFMAGQWRKVFGVAFWAVSAVILTAPACAASGVASLEQLARSIARVQTGESRAARDSAAERLPELTKSVRPDQIDDKTLADLVSLLDTWDDEVRVPVALSLGNLGPRAKIAAPKLLEMLPEVDCLMEVDVPPALVVRDALQRIGETPPPSPTCETKVDPAIWNQRLRQTIAKVQTSDSSLDRAKAAVRLAYLTHFLPPNAINEETIFDLVALLDIAEEPVRAEVAASLCNIGPRAKAAIPKLEELLRETNCQRSNEWSSGNIRYALERMGVKPHAASCGKSG